MFDGLWVNQNGSELRFQQVGERITGEYITRIGDDDAIGEAHTLNGSVIGPIIGFVVAWKASGSLTSWAGKVVKASDGSDQLHTLWHLVRHSVGDPPRETQVWESFLTQSSVFVRKATPARTALSAPAVAASKQKKRLAIIGAGPSGLAAAKSALECGVEPTIFEAGDSLGGLWRPNSGFVWPGMRTNLSKWTCAFSDFDWPDQADEFPQASEVVAYLKRYSSQYKVDENIEFNEAVLNITPIDAGWNITTTKRRDERFSSVIISSGVFSKPFQPPIPGLEKFKGKVRHSGEYRSDIRPGARVAVIGASLSGIEISSHLADAGAEVLMLFSKAPWILPRYFPNGEDKAPLDLMLYRRAQGPVEPPSDVRDQYRRTSKFFEETFGNPGDHHPALRIPIDGTPPSTAISDTFYAGLSGGGITPINHRLVEVTENGVIADDGKPYNVDEIIFCTGYETDLSFLPVTAQQMIEYDQRDKFISFIADRATHHPKLPNLYFCGVYRGPYFGVMELQGRWAAMESAGLLPTQSQAESDRMLAKERKIRASNPRPQFPHGDYVPFADSIALRLGLDFAELDEQHQFILDGGPVTPAQYRLIGPFATPEKAILSIGSARKRVGMD